jgi:hypothetical protein
VDQQSIQPGIYPGSEYPPPPAVHWFALLLASIAAGILINWLAPAPYRNLLQSLVGDGWAFYLCLWIRQIEPDSHTAFWCDAYVVVELGYAALTIRQNPIGLLEITTGILGFASFALGIATIYMIRADLLKHYNEREPIGIYLSPVLTFFFSFLYFQSQLYEIAKQKKRLALGFSGNPSRTLF